MREPAQLTAQRRLGDLAQAPSEVVSRVLQLNQEHAVELSPLDSDELIRLASIAFRAAVVGAGDAFLLAFDQDASYRSANFLWFGKRLPRFVYVDRVAVGASVRRTGLADALYADLFRAAKAAGHAVVTCEVNLIPSNPASDSFHERLGFREIGRGESAGKTVRYLLRELR